MPEMCRLGAPSKQLSKTREYTRRTNLETCHGSKQTRKRSSSSSRNRNAKRRRPVVGKRRKSPVGGGLRDNDEKAIKERGDHALLSNTAYLENENDHLMIGVKLSGKNREVTVTCVHVPVIAHRSEAVQDLLCLVML